VKTGREKHPRFHLHLTPTRFSWLNLAERWLGEPFVWTKTVKEILKKIKHGKAGIETRL